MGKRFRAVTRETWLQKSASFGLAERPGQIRIPNFRIRDWDCSRFVWLQGSFLGSIWAGLSEPIQTDYTTKSTRLGSALQVGLGNRFGLQKIALFVWGVSWVSG